MRYSISLLVLLGLALLTAGCANFTSSRPQATRPPDFTEVPLPFGCDNDLGCKPIGITSGPDGNLWFTESLGDTIGRITPNGTITEFALPTTCSGNGCVPVGITKGSDGNLWFTEDGGNRIGRMTPAGRIQEFALPTACGGNGCVPEGITSGPDGNLWFTDSGGNNIENFSP